MSLAQVCAYVTIVVLAFLAVSYLAGGSMEFQRIPARDWMIALRLFAAGFALFAYETWPDRPAKVLLILAILCVSVSVVIWLSGRKKRRNLKARCIKFEHRDHEPPRNVYKFARRSSGIL